MSPLAPLGFFAHPPLAAGDFESISTVTVGAGGASSVSFSSIPSTFKHLQIRAIMKASDSIYMSFNSDTTNSNYYSHWLTGQGSSASASSFAGRLAPVIMAGTGASGFSAVIWDVLDYADANKYKTVRVLTGHDQNGSGEVGLTSMLWKSTSATTQIDIAPVSGSSISQYSSFALYGIRGE